MGSAMTSEYMTRPIDSSFRAWQELPAHHPEQGTGPERNQQQHQAKPCGAPGAEYEKIGDRIRQGSRQHRHAEGHSDRDPQKSPVTADRDHRLVLL